jgi:hypothetical protein
MTSLLAIKKDPLEESGIIITFNDQTVFCKSHNISIKNRNTCILSSAEVLIKVFMSKNEPKTLKDEYSWATKTLDAEYSKCLQD